MATTMRISIESQSFLVPCSPCSIRVQGSVQPRGSGFAVRRARFGCASVPANVEHELSTEKREPRPVATWFLVLSAGSRRHRGGPRRPRQASEFLDQPRQHGDYAVDVGFGVRGTQTEANRIL